MRYTHNGEARVAVEQWGNPDSALAVWRGESLGAGALEAVTNAADSGSDSAGWDSAGWVAQRLRQPDCLLTQQKPNDEPQLFWFFCSACSFAGHFDLHQGQPRMIEKYPPCCSEGYSPGLALQQLYADLQF